MDKQGKKFVVKSDLKGKFQKLIQKLNVLIAVFQ